MYKAILFDFWGTLARISNSEDLVKETKKTLGKKRYAEFAKQFIEWHLKGKAQKKFIQDLKRTTAIGAKELPVIEKFLNPTLYEKYPETDEALKKLKDADIKLILISNSPPPSKKAFKALDLPRFFDKTVFSCEIGVMKPDKRIFERAIKHLNVKPEEIVMVGDSLEKDVAGATSAGLNAILLDRKGLIKYDSKITNLLELVEVVNLKITNDRIAAARVEHGKILRTTRNIQKKSKKFTFLDPGKLTDGDLELVVVKTAPANQKKDYVPWYQFKMRHTKTGKKIGDITLRIGYNENIKYGGNIGYGVVKTFQGNHYASRSVKLLLPFAKKHGITTLWITCNPENTASRRTCELAGGKLIEIVDLPKHNEQYKRGERKKCRYQFEL